MDSQLTLSANSKESSLNALSASKIDACATGTLTRGVGKIGLHGPLPLAQSTTRSMGRTARATFYIHTYISHHFIQFAFRHFTECMYHGCEGNRKKEGSEGTMIRLYTYITMFITLLVTHNKIATELFCDGHKGFIYVFYNADTHTHSWPSCKRSDDPTLE